MLLMRWGLCGLLIACGARTGLGGAQHDASPPSGGLCLGTLPSTTTSAPLGAACAFGTAGTSLAVVAGTSFLLVDRSQSTKLLFSFFANAPGVLPSQAFVTSRGKYIAAMLIGYSQPNTNQAHIEVVIFDVTTGGQLAHDEYDAPENGGFGGPEGLFGNDGGTFVHGFPMTANDSGMRILSSTGKASQPALNIVPMGDPSADQIVPVYQENDSGDAGDVFWFDPCTSALTPSHEHSVQAAEGAVAIGSRIVYLDYATWTLFDEGPHDFQPLALADLGDSFRVVDVNPSGWVLLATNDPLEFVLANVALGAKHAVSLKSLPPSYWLLNPLDAGIDPTGMRATSDGALIIPLRNPNQGMLYKNLGSTWSPIGLPIGQVYDATPIERSGTYLMYATWEPVTMDWPPPTGGRVDGTGTQLAAGTITSVLENVGANFGLTRNYAISNDGGCVAWFDDHLHLESAVTGATAALNLPQTGMGSVFASTWIEGADTNFFGAP